MLSFISYLTVLIISFFFNIFPRKVSLLIGRWIGIFIFYIIPIRKKVALQNIKDNFTNLNNIQQLNLLKKTYMHFGMVLSDFLRQKTLNKNIIDKTVNIDDKTINLLRKNEGSIIMTGHLGNWEYFLPILGLNNIKFSIVAQKIKNDYLNKLFLKNRTFMNVEVIFKKDGKEKMIKALDDNFYLGLASDQNAGKRGTIVKLLNINISIPKGAAIFHLKTKKPIFIGYCVMNKDYSYNFYIEELNISKVKDSKLDIIKNINSIFTDSLGEMILKYPEQYFWFHKMKNKTDY
jgi:Kdo2-lipid IVA lauroyltransferase/acyltransferase